MAEQYIMSRNVVVTIEVIAEVVYVLKGGVIALPGATFAAQFIIAVIFLLININ